MLENYYEEIGRKRRERWAFWIVVWALSVFLYLFFQGYYPYVKFDTWKFLETAEKHPEEVVDAWVAVLVDIWEKDQAAANEAQAGNPTEEGDSSCDAT